MDVAFAQQHIRASLELHLGEFLGIVEYGIAEVGLPHVRAGRYDLAPHEASAHAGGGGNDDARRGFAFPGFRAGFEQDPIMEHPDR